MMTRSQTRIAELEEEKEFYKDLHEGFAYKLFLKEKELQARVVELEKENKKLKKGVWSVLVEDDNVNSNTFVFKTEAEAVKWREATFKVKEAIVNVYHVIFIPFRTFEESMDEFAEPYARELWHDNENEDYECEECGVSVIAADIPENECREIAYGCLSMAFCKPCYERSWAEHPENPTNEALYARQQRKLDLGIVDSDFDSDEDTDEECEECCRGKGDRPQINCVCERCNRIICRDCQANSHYVPDTCDFCWEKLNAVIDPDQYVDDGKGEYELTAYEFAIDKIIDEHTDCRRHLCQRREHLSKRNGVLKTAFKQWVKKDE